MKIFNLYISMLVLTSAVALANSEYETLLVQQVKNSIENAKNGVSRLDDRVLSIDGMSSSKVRHLLNNLCSLPSTSYLEIGVWQGSTLISALFGNRNSISHAIAVDNWSQFGGPKMAFMQNITKLLSAKSVHFYDQDCFSINKAIFKYPVTTYFYDGDHDQESQYKAFTYFNDVFADVFIAVVDDWNWDAVQVGTRNAFKDLGYQVLFEEVLLANYTGDKEGWWNGLYIGVIKKGVA